MRTSLLPSKPKWKVSFLTQEQSFSASSARYQDQDEVQRERNLAIYLELRERKWRKIITSSYFPYFRSFFHSFFPFTDLDINAKETKERMLFPFSYPFLPYTVHTHLLPIIPGNKCFSVRARKSAHLQKKSWFFSWLPQLFLPRHVMTVDENVVLRDFPRNRSVKAVAHFLQ